METPYHLLRVARVVPETDEARSFVLEIPDALREDFRYRAGQFLTFRVTVDGRRLVRCYSLASAPEGQEAPKVTVKRIHAGRVSNWMNEHVAEGDVLEVMKPTGRFCLTEGSRPVVLLAAGSGITPCISLLKSALASPGRRVRLVYANRDRGSTIFDAELAELAARHGDRFRRIDRLDADEGFVDVDAVCGYVEGAGDADFYICGPAPFMDVAEAGLDRLGVAPERIFIERFEYASDGTPTAAAPPAAAPASAEAGSDVLTILLDGATHEVPYQPGQTVIEAARAGGVDPPTACEEGYCACCMARLEEGAGTMKANDVLGKKELAEGWVLTCQLVPKGGPLRVRYPD